MVETSSVLVFEHHLSLAPYTTFGIGGPARLACFIRTASQMQAVLAQLIHSGERYIVIGKGSNLLFDQRGFDGVVVLNRIDTCSEVGELMEVGAGYSFALLGTRSARSGLSGLEFAAGVPGSVGGAVFMNAGSAGQETADVLHAVEVIYPSGERCLLARDALQFSYRTSPFQSSCAIILSATFKLAASNEARKDQLRLLELRKTSQPLQEKSAGCIFRNPLCASAGALIDQCGLKGHQIGGAAVSMRHANFIVNAGLATSDDVLALIAHIKEEVKRQRQIDLEEEVRYVPYC